MAYEQLDILASEGVTPDWVVISHVGFSKNPVAESESLLKPGANIRFDHIGLPVFFRHDHLLRQVANAVCTA